MISHSKPDVTDADRRAVGDVLASGMLAQGNLVQEFEKRVADYTGVRGGVATASGTAALTLALKALNVKPGDEVILPTYVCRSVMESVASAGAKSILCDIGTEWNMTAETVAPHITRRTRAIIVVHIFGISADARLFKQFGVPVIEDCCQAFGAVVGGQRVGAWGDTVMFSFNAIKCLTTGEGGMVATNNVELLERMRALRDGGDDLSPTRERIAAPLTDLQASLGLSQLARYDLFLRRRKHIAEIYFAELKHLPVQLPVSVLERSMFFRFPVLTEGDFERQREQFASWGVHVRRGVDLLLHRLIGENGAAYPAAERTFKETVSLPIYPALSDDDIEQVLRACRAVWN